MRWAACKPLSLTPSCFCLAVGCGGRFTCGSLTHSQGRSSFFHCLFLSILLQCPWTLMPWCRDARAYTAMRMMHVAYMM